MRCPNCARQPSQAGGIDVTRKEEHPMTFQIFGLQPDTYQHLIGKDENVLAHYGAERHFVTEAHSAPCRISLDDADVGETVILVSHPHQTAFTPYRQSGPIFLRENMSKSWSSIDAIPPALARRTLSVRGYDAQGNIILADLAEGAALSGMLASFLENQAVEEVHIHFARRGCFAAKARRA
jgi:hypothetical protein